MILTEILDILKIFNENNLSEDEQREIFSNGIYFDFAYDDLDIDNKNRHLNVFEVAILLKTLNHNNLPVDVSKMIKSPSDFEYPNLVRTISDLKEKKEDKIKIMLLESKKMGD